MPRFEFVDTSFNQLSETTYTPEKQKPITTLSKNQMLSDGNTGNKIKQADIKEAKAAKTLT